VTGLGEFSPIGKLFSLGSFLKITEVAGTLGLRFFHGTSYEMSFIKRGLATFWAFFSQTHLVTLSSTNIVFFFEGPLPQVPREG
jgi:hypothetical protein